MRKLIIIAIAMLAACSSSPERKPLPEPVTDARDAYELAVDAFNVGRYRDAIAGFHRAERRFLSLDDPHGVSAAAISQAEIQLLLGENDNAAKSLQGAKAAIARTGNKALSERVQLMQARLAMEDDPANARKLLSTLGDAMTPSVATQARLLLCELEMLQGETDCAASLTADGPSTTARIAHLQARAALQRGDLEAANVKLERALDIYRSLAFRPGIAAVHESSADLAMQANKREVAKEHLERALYLRLWIRDRVHAAEILAQLAQLGDNDEPYQRWRKTLLDESGEPEWDKMMEKLFTSR
ncbi:MAG TPA: hypothetical protein VF275_08805 [Gammaproteobacteria bacterium]